MWNLKDSNAKVGLFMKVSRFKHHITKLKNTKSSLSPQCTQPWRPSFSLSRNCNRYSKNKMSERENENGHLIRKITDIELHPKIKTLMDVPIYVPSNKENYKYFKLRERQSKSRVISRENSALSVKLSSVSKSYENKAFEKQWQSSRVYGRNISKKEKLHDYVDLALSQIQSERRTFNIHSQEKKERLKRIVVNTEKLSGNRSELLSVSTSRKGRPKKFIKIF